MTPEPLETSRLTEDTIAATYLEEYRDLRSEIHQRVNNQLLVVGGNVALTAALIPIVLDVVKDRSATTVLAIPVVFAVVAWLYFEQDLFVAQAATYLHQELRPALIAHLERSNGVSVARLMAWERFRGDVLFARRLNRVLLRFMTAFRLSATAGPGLACLVTGIYLNVDRDGWPWHWPIAGVVLALVDTAVAGFMIFMGFHVLRLYREISFVHDKPTPPVVAAAGASAIVETTSTGVVVEVAAVAGAAPIVPELGGEAGSATPSEPSGDAGGPPRPRSSAETQDPANPHSPAP